MRIRRCGDHAFQLTRYPALFPMNCYVVLEEDGATLVDSTIASPAEAVLRLCREQGVELRRIALTHAHGDHVGGVAGVLAAAGEVEVSIGGREAKLLAGDKRLEAGEPPQAPRGQFVRVAWRPGRLLEPGDRVGSLEVVAAPGHTPGHVAFIDTRDRTLIAGDAFQTRGGMAVAGVLRPLFPFPALGTWDRPTALASARTLVELGPARLAVGHGDVLEDPGAAMRGAIAAAERAFGSKRA